MRAEGQREHGSLWANSPSLDIKRQIQQEILSPQIFVNKQTNKKPAYSVCFRDVTLKKIKRYELWQV